MASDTVQASFRVWRWPGQRSSVDSPNATDTSTATAPIAAAAPPDLRGGRHGGLPACPDRPRRARQPTGHGPGPSEWPDHHHFVKKSHEQGTVETHGALRSSLPSPRRPCGRFPLYHRCLLDLRDEGPPHGNLRAARDLAGVNAAKVRKDLSHFGSVRHPGGRLRRRPPAGSRDASAPTSTGLALRHRRRQPGSALATFAGFHQPWLHRGRRARRRLGQGRGPPSIAHGAPPGRPG